jgi:hypothetical protein
LPDSGRTTRTGDIGVSVSSCEGNDTGEFKLPLKSRYNFKAGYPALSTI